MTLEEFLNDYVPNVLAPLGGWKAEDAIRREEVGYGTMVVCCPLTAERGRGAGYAMYEGHRLGLDADDRVAIINAADGAPGPVRRRLLMGLGLPIPAAERSV